MTEHMTLPDGQYIGRWSGHTLAIEYEGHEFTVQTALGVRGINIPVTLEWKCGNVVEDSITPN